MSPAHLADPLTPSLRDFVLDLGDAVLVLEPGGRVVLANPAARQMLGAAVPPLPAPLAHVLGQQAARRVQALLLDDTKSGGGVQFPLGNGRSVQAQLHRLDGAHRALRLRAPARAVEPADTIPAALEDGTAHELIGMFWDSPFPALLQDQSFRLVAVNDAFVQFSGRPRESLVGLDPVLLVPEEDRHVILEQRAQDGHDPAMQHAGALYEQRLLDATGRERWFRAARRVLGEGGRPLFLAVLQDCTAEHAAREQADRSERDLEQWFDMSPLGMVLFDGSGLLVRTNPAFEQLVGAPPITLPEAPAALQQLLAWEGDRPSASLVPGTAPLRRDGWLGRPGSLPRRLRATLRAYETPGGHRRFMAAVQDLSAEEERDLARMQIGALMDTAGVGLATLSESGWTAPPTPIPTPVPSRQGDDERRRRVPVSAALQSISRDLVLAESMPEYERLQQALRHGQRVEARYAIRHPELGKRWLLTRVEPAQLASGQRTTSVVTLDITDQEQARSRNEQLLRELGSILESSPAGIVHLRGDMLLRCNAAFERLVGLTPGSAAGRRLQEVFGRLPGARRLLDELIDAIGPVASHEAEFELARADGITQWVSLSARGYATPSGARDVIAVLSDISRLKLQQAELELLARDRELMFSLSEVGIAFVREGRIQRANQALQTLTGHDARTLGGLALQALFLDREHYQRQWAAEEAALRLHGRWSGERLLRRADGTQVWVQVSKRLAVPGDAGSGLIASYVNVDDRHRAEASLALQADTVRAILDSVLVGIVTVGPEGIEWLNRSARRMFGGELQDFLGLPIETVAGDEPDHPFRRRHYLAELTEGQAETFECRVRARDGRSFWVAGNVVATRHLGAGRQLTYALLDIERRREAEQRTAQAQASLQRIIDMAPLAIGLGDARSGQLLQTNPTARHWIGASMEAGEQPDEQVARQIADGIRLAVDAGEMVAREDRREHGGGASVWDTRYLPLPGDDGRPEQVLVVATDVTEQRAAQQARLEAAIAQRDRLVQEVHHRIKNNLQGVAGLMQQIAQRRPQVADVIAEAVGQVQAIAQVYGLQVGATGPLRVRSVVEAIAGAVGRSAGRPIEFTITGEGAAQWHRWALPEAESIPIALTLNELLSNAVRHSTTTGDGATPERPLRCELVLSHEDVMLRISNPGRLPEGFNLARVPGGMSGLGLVRALLPRRHARFTLAEEGEDVVATVALAPPGVTLLAPL